MSFNGSGTFVVNSSGQPIVDGQTSSATVQNALSNDLAAGLTLALCKDGQSTPTGDIKLGNFKLTGVGAPTTAGDALSYGSALGTPASGVATNLTGLPISTGLTGLGTGVATALAVNVGSAGAPVVFNGALGTPSSATLTNATGLPIASGVSGLGTGVATFLATPSSAALASAVTDETGSGALVFGTSPTLVTPALGTPSSGALTNCTGLPIATGVSGYSENTWTPVLAFGGASTGITYSVQTATYTKIGRVIFVNCNLALSSKGSATGAATIGGLPTAASGTYGAALGYHGLGVSNATALYLTLANGATQVALTKGVLDPVTNSDFSGTDFLYFEFFYFV